MSAWTLFPWHLLRATGFPFRLITDLADGPPLWETEADQIDRCRLQLWEQCQHPTFLEALFQSNPDGVDRVKQWKASFHQSRNSKARVRERFLLKYLQRFAAKNDSCSFFGAVAASRFDGVSTPEAMPIATTRRVFINHWIVSAILSRAQQNLDLELVLPSGVADPLAAGKQQLERLPDSVERNRWLERMNQLEAVQQTYAVSDLTQRQRIFAETEQQLEQWLGDRPRRYPGAYHASRTFLHEMADRTNEVVHLPAAWGEELTRACTGYFDLCLMERVRSRLLFRAWFRTQEQKAHRWSDLSEKFFHQAQYGSMPVTAPYRHAAEQLQQVRAVLGQRLSEHLERHGAGTPLSIDLAPHRPQIGEVLALEDGIAFVNPDLMVDPSAEVRFLLAESHYLPLLTGSLLLALSSMEPIVRDTERLLKQLCAPAQPALLCPAHHTFFSNKPDYGFVALETDGSASFPPQRRARFAELRIEEQEGRLRFSAPNHAQASTAVLPLTRAFGLDLATELFAVPLPPFSAVATLEKHPRHYPRVLCDGVVVQRQQWRVPSDGLDARTALQAATKLRAHCGDTLPRFTFIHSADEPKPILIDWANPLFVELAVWMARRVPELTLVEMDPAPSELWLRSGEGLHTSELRTVWFRGQ